ncbi:hypothetical protein BTA51_27090 [Hahella sp. CCB-MM4]|uniref:hypothetical protein n=1 Tax=Hahella sp. (strain CCB-MM4) TaxID=1926491 RepID=UPI000B9BDCC2|nr:hypothetical protein [Hahella sp. CCB-MM4]OZG70266.1 hypothetical protein BTA51_27090 [Hahella sp. CCB-MM4]
MKQPPRKIDGAIVVEWALSGDIPFGWIPDDSGNIVAEIFGLAICQYKKSGNVYRFSCDADWETEQDSVYRSIEEAKAHIPAQYKNTNIHWRKMIEE